MQTALNALIPSFVKRAQKNPYFTDTYTATRAAAARLLAAAPVESSRAVQLLDWDADAEDKVLAAIRLPPPASPPESGPQRSQKPVCGAALRAVRRVHPPPPPPPR